MSNVRLQVLFDIRDARGLNSHEKTFLLIVETRGTMKAKWETAAADMGMKKDTFYRTRDSLKAKGLLAILPTEGATQYWVNAEILQDFLGDSHSENASPTENAASHSANGDSLYQNGDSHQPEQKETRKENKKETTKTREVREVSTDTYFLAKNVYGETWVYDDRGGVSCVPIREATEADLVQIPWPEVV